MGNKKTKTRIITQDKYVEKNQTHRKVSKMMKKRKLKDSHKSILKKEKNEVSRKT